MSQECPAFQGCFSGLFNAVLQKWDFWDFGVKAERSKNYYSDGLCDTAQCHSRVHTHQLQGHLSIKVKIADYFPHNKNTRSVETRGWGKPSRRGAGTGTRPRPTDPRHPHAQDARPLPGPAPSTSARHQPLWGRSHTRQDSVPSPP